MDQDPTPPQQDNDPGPQANGNPGVFTKLNGTIAGITGLVIALGGLAATWDRIFPGDKGNVEAAVPAQLTNAEAVPADETAADPTADEPEAGDPTSYSGQLVDGGKVLTIEWNGDSWDVTVGDDNYSYDDTLSPDETRVMAVSGGSYLRWPIAGGEVDESDDKIKWKTYGSVQPAAEPAQ